MNIASPSVINRLIVEEIMESSQGSTLRDRFRRGKNKLSAKQALAVAEMEASEQGNEYTEEESAIVDDLENKQNEIVRFNATFQQIVDEITKVGTYNHNQHLSFLQTFVVQFNKFREDFFKAHSDVDFKDAEDEGPYRDAKVIVTQIYNEIDEKYNNFEEDSTVATQFFDSLKNTGAIGSTIETMKDIQLNLDTAPIDPPEQAAAALGAPETEAAPEDEPSVETTPLEAARKIATDSDTAKKAADTAGSMEGAKAAIEASKENATKPETMSEEDFNAIFDKAFEAMKVHLPSEEEGDTTEAGTIGKIDAAKAYKDIIDGKEYSPESAMISFVEEFLKVRHLKDQVSLIDNLIDALEQLENKIKGTDEKALQESMLNVTTGINAARKFFGRSGEESEEEEEAPEIRNDVDLSTTQVKTLEQKKAEMIQQLKALSDMMKEIDEKSTSVASRYIKTQVIKSATALQDIISDIHKEVQNPKPMTEEVDPTPKRLSRKEKSDNVKAAFANIQPLILNLDKIMDNWEDKEDNSDVDASALLSRIDRIRDIITPIRPYFQLKTSAFTNNRIEFKDLKTMLRKITLQLIDVMKRVDNAVDDEMVEPADANTLLNKLANVSGLIEKYIGPPSKIKTTSSTPFEEPEPKEEESESFEAIIEPIVDIEIEELDSEIFSDFSEEDFEYEDIPTFFGEFPTAENIIDDIRKELVSSEESIEEITPEQQASIEKMVFDRLKDKIKGTTVVSDENIAALFEDNDYKSIKKTLDGLIEYLTSKNPPEFNDGEDNINFSDYFDTIISEAKIGASEIVDEFSTLISALEGTFDSYKTAKTPIADLADVLFGLQKIQDELNGLETESKNMSGEEIKAKIEDVTSDIEQTTGESPPKGDSNQILSHIKTFLRNVNKDTLSSENYSKALKKAYDTLFSTVRKSNPKLTETGGYIDLSGSGIVITHNKAILFQIAWYSSGFVAFTFTDGKGFFYPDRGDIKKELILQAKEVGKKVGDNTLVTYELVGKTKKGNRTQKDNANYEKEESYEDVWNSLNDKLKLAPEGFVEKLKSFFTRRKRLEEQVQIKLERLIEMKLQDYISQNRNLKSVFPSGYLNPEYDNKPVDSLLNTFTNGSIDSGSPFSILLNMAKRLGGGYPAYTKNLLGGIPYKTIEATKKLNMALNKQDFYNTLESLYQDEMKAVIVFISSRDKSQDTNLRQESYVLVGNWLSVYRSSRDGSKEIIDLYTDADAWYKQYRKVLSLAGIKAEDKLVIVDPSMEERLIKKLAPLVEKTIKRKQHG